MTRRVTHHRARTIENEFLQVITVFEEGMKKEEVKKLNPYSKKHQILVKRNEQFEFTR